MTDPGATEVHEAIERAKEVLGEGTVRGVRAALARSRAGAALPEGEQGWLKRPT